jgi:hypothetical protein
MDGRLLNRHVVARNVNILCVLPPVPVLECVCVCVCVCYGHADPGVRGLRRRAAAALLLGSPVRIQLQTWIFACYACFVRTYIHTYAHT